jgi:outer membrane protein OmpA-like peptidoglycan-associated protein
MRGGSMKKEFIFTLVLLLSVAGCRRERKKAVIKTSHGTTAQVQSAVDIPTSDGISSMRSIFEDDINEFAPEESPIAALSVSGQNEMVMVEQMDGMTDVMWEEDAKGDTAFKTVYFDWDSHSIRKDQEEVIAYNAELAKQIIAEHEAMGLTAPTFVIEGHSCTAGKASNTYKLVLSEKRAKALSDRLVSLGLPQEHIKIVGRGVEMPAVVDGAIVDGSRKEQWPNRRDEMRMIYS